MSRAAKLNVKAEWTGAVERAIARGELPAGTDADLIFELLTGAIVDAFVPVTHVVDDRFLAGMVDLVIAGAIHAGAVRRRGAPTLTHGLIDDTREAALPRARRRRRGVPEA